MGDCKKGVPQPMDRIKQNGQTQKFTFNRNLIDKPSVFTPSRRMFRFSSAYASITINHRHNTNNLPAVIGRSWLSWYKKGGLHNSHGPAQIFFNETKSDEYQYWLNNVRYIEEDWKVLVGKNSK